MQRPRRVYPPVVYGLALIVAAVGHLLLPLPLPGAWWVRAAGGALFVAASALALWATRTFEAARTTLHPYHEARTLVTDGPFRFSRNPIYLSFSMMTVAIGLVTASCWPLIVLVPAVAVMRVVIGWEERMLRRVFGPAYVRYAARTRRWL